MSESKQQSLPPGYELAEFEILHELGSGGFGITYLARDHSLERDVVIKENLPIFAFRDPSTSTVHPKSAVGEDRDLFAWSLRSFIREARTLAKFDHPNIVKILRVFASNGTAYFVMPYLEGRTFSEWIGERKTAGGIFAEEELRALLLPLLEALEVLHGQQVYHRDIKPGNVLVTSRGTPVLIDFGAARQMLSERSHTVVESPGYTPFEQLQSRGNVGAWSDLYGLAATFYKALTFENPPKANDRVKRDAITKLGEDRELRGRLSHELLTSLDAALAFDEEDRPQTARVMMALLERSRVEDEERGNEVDIEERSSEFAEVEIEEEYVPAEVPSKPHLDSVAEESISAVASGLIKSRGRSGPQNQGKLKRQGSQRSEGPRRKVLVSISAVGLLIALIVTMKAIVENPGTKTSAPEDRSLRPTSSTPSPVVRPANAPPAATTTKVAASSAPAPSTPAPESRDMEGRRAGEVREFAGIEVVWCPPGEFLMGSPESEEGRVDNETQHRVTLTKGFWMAKTETTQRQWENVMGNNPSSYKGNSLPVETVSWVDIKGYLTKMNTLNSLSPGWKWVLPTEAQWEYACRAGTNTKFAGTLFEMDWYSVNSELKTHPVKTKKANVWGIHDMHGNVSEWCAHWSDEYENGSVIDPRGVDDDSITACRGGSWGNQAWECRSAVRSYLSTDTRIRGLGFRVAAVPAER